MNKSNIMINEIEKLVSGKTFEEIKTITKNTNINVRELDTLDLYLLTSQDNEIVENKDLTNQANGIILEKETNKIVCMCQNKFLTVNHNTIEEFNKNSYARMEYCEDGTVIRLYNYNNKWMTATTKCIDAKYSYWSSYKSFDNMFWDTFSSSHINIDTLDPLYTYMFILIHTENRIVVEHKYNNLIYINRINNLSQLEDYTNYFYNENPKRSIRRTKCIKLSLDEKIHTFDKYYLPSKKGIILKIFNENTNNWSIFLQEFDSYKKVKEIRGNVPLIRMRYLELLNNQEMLSSLEENYKENSMLFTLIKHQLKNIYKSIHKLYFDSHVKHNITVNENHIFFKTLKQLHSIYYKTNTPITLQDVQNKVDTLDKNILKKFLNWV